ncbi:MAG: DUF1559 domain-containing protein, partial [Planctomycetia bacterium]|nr:DUF1559 domain-containing protein [Planctomycetia bacterium]
MKRGCCYTLLVLFVLVGLYAWNLFVSVPLEISPETTVITEPLTPDGRAVDIFALMRAEYPAEMKTEKNAAREILRRLGPGENLYQNLRTIYDGRFYDSGRDATEAETVAKYKEYYDALGLDPVALDAKSETPYVTPEKMYETWLDAQFSDRSEIPERLHEFKTRTTRFQNASISEYFEVEPEFVREWLTQNSPALDAVAEAVKKAEFCKFPYDFPTYKNATPMDILLPGVDDVFGIRDGFLLRIAVSVAEGRFDDAISDYETCLKFGRQIQKESAMLIEYLSGYSFEDWLRRYVNFSANPDFQPTAEQWKRIQELDVHNLEVDIKQIPKKEHLLIIGNIQSAALYPRVDSYLGYDWNLVARRFNEYYSRCFYEDEFHSPVEISEEYSDYHWWQIVGMFLTRSARSETMAIVLNQIFNESMYNYVTVNPERKSCTVNLHRLGIAMQRYRLEHDGKLPPAFSVDAEGKPLHSWRVLILPYIGLKECDELYAKIRLNEPWDSEHNRQFHAEMPEIYKCQAWKKSAIARAKSWEKYSESEMPSEQKRYLPPLAEKTFASETNYAVVVDEHLFFDNTGTGRDYIQVMRDEPTRKVKKMALIVERTNSVPWMRPDGELTREELNRMIGHRNSMPHGYEDALCVSCSGAVEMELLDSDEFRTWINGTTEPVYKILETEETEETE